MVPGRLFADIAILTRWLYSSTNSRNSTDDPSSREYCRVNYFRRVNWRYRRYMLAVFQGSILPILLILAVRYFGVLYCGHCRYF